MAKMVIELENSLEKDVTVNEIMLDMLLRLPTSKSVSRVIATIGDKLTTILPSSPWWFRWI